MDKKRAIANVSVSIFFKIVILFVSLISRRFLIQMVGNVAVGLDALFSSIIGVLSITELGVGTAITFCMYRPIVEKKNDTVSALFFLFKRVYTVIGVIIFVAGILLVPFLPHLAKDYNYSGINIYLAFSLLLSSTVITYFFGCKVSLINAYKNNYITSAVSSTIIIIRYLMQIAVVCITKSFIYYILCFLVTTIFHWITISIITKKKYPEIIHNKQKIDAETKSEVMKNIRAMFVHKIGEVMVNSTDNIIISSFIGVTVLGKYSNYIAIITAMTGVIGLFFTPLVSVIGHLYTEDIKECYSYYKFFHKFNFLLGAFFFLGYFAIVDSFISIVFGTNLNLARVVCIVITFNYFVQFMRRATLLFREATGAFYYDRWKPFVEGICNVVLSILFVKIFPEKYNVVGVLVATIITNLAICHIVEPLMLHKHVFNDSPKPYYFRNAVYIVSMFSALVLLDKIMISTKNSLYDLFVNGFIAVGLFVIIFTLFVVFDKSFRKYLTSIFKKKGIKKE